MVTTEVTMRPAEWLQEVRMKRFEEAYDGWQESRLSQEEAARILGVSDRTFRRYVERYDDGGMEASTTSGSPGHPTAGHPWMRS
jgi:transposase